MEREEEARPARRDAERAKKGHRASLDGVKRELHKLQVGGLLLLRLLLCAFFPFRGLGHRQGWSLPLHCIHRKGCKGGTYQQGSRGGRAR